MSELFCGNCGLQFQSNDTFCARCATPRDTNVSDTTVVSKQHQDSQTAHLSFAVPTRVSELKHALQSKKTVQILLVLYIVLGTVMIVPFELFPELAVRTIIVTLWLIGGTIIGGYSFYVITQLEEVGRYEEASALHTAKVLMGLGGFLSLIVDLLWWIHVFDQRLGAFFVIAGLIFAGFYLTFTLVLSVPLAAANEQLVISQHGIRAILPPPISSGQDQSPPSPPSPSAVRWRISRSEHVLQSKKRLQFLLASYIVLGVIMIVPFELLSGTVAKTIIVTLWFTGGASIGQYTVYITTRLIEPSTLQETLTLRSARTLAGFAGFLSLAVNFLWWTYAFGEQLGSFFFITGLILAAFCFIFIKIVSVPLINVNDELARRGQSF